MLMFLYPLAMVLIFLSVFSPFFNRDGVVYAFVVVMTIVPALGDMVVAFPSVVSASAFGQLVATWRDAVRPGALLGRTRLNRLSARSRCSRLAGSSSRYL